MTENRVRPEKSSAAERFEREIKYALRARVPLIQIVTPEEWRALSLLDAIKKDVASHALTLRTWTVADGLQTFDPECFRTGKWPKPDVDTLTLPLVLEKIRDMPPTAGTIFVLQDAHAFMDDGNGAASVRMLRDIALRFRRSRNAVVLLTPSYFMAPGLEHDMHTLDLPLPALEELENKVARIFEMLQKDKRARESLALEDGSRRLLIDVGPTLVTDVARASAGLTSFEAEDVVTRAMAEIPGVNDRMIDIVMREKRRIVQQAGVLEFVEATESMDNVAGLSAIKEFVWKYQDALSDDAREFGVESPKGLLVLGIPGGGKSLVAKAIASQWRMPLLRIDMSRILSKWVGDSEANIRTALKQAEAISPCVLMVDEVEKLFGQSGRDSGVSDRIRAQLLTWMQENTSPVFVYFTANGLDGKVPPELMRAGRIDETFYVDVPTLEARVEAFRIHLRKRGRNPSAFDLEALAQSTSGYVGAEIEQIVKNAVLDVHVIRRQMKLDGNASAASKRHLTTDDLARACERTVPLIQSRKDEIEEMRKSCAKHGYRNADEPTEGARLPEPAFPI